MYEIFYDVPPNQNSGAAPAYSIGVYCIYCTRIFMLSLVPPPQIFIRGGPHVTRILLYLILSISNDRDFSGSPQGLIFAFYNHYYYYYSIIYIN